MSSLKVGRVAKNIVFDSTPKRVVKSVVFNSTPTHLWVSSLAKCVLTAFRMENLAHIYVGSTKNLQ